MFRGVENNESQGRRRGELAFFLFAVKTLIFVGFIVAISIYIHHLATEVDNVANGEKEGEGAISNIVENRRQLEAMINSIE